MAENMGVTGGDKFENKCGPLMVEVKNKFLDYVVGLHQAASPNEISTLTTPFVVPPELDLKLDPNGFPSLPERPAEGSLRKAELEVLIRAYLNAHYCAPGIITVSHSPTDKLCRSCIRTYQESDSMEFSCGK